MYTIIGSTKTRSARVIWFLEELGVGFGHVSVGPRSAEALAHNPSGKVPVLVADGVNIADSTAIMTYLADKHGRFTAPAGTIARAKQDSLTQFLLDEFDAVLWTAARHSFILPPDMRLPAIKDSLRWEFARSVDALLARMDAPYVLGAEMTLPDIILTHCLHWANVSKFPVASPRLTDYLAQMQARPAFQRAMAR